MKPDWTEKQGSEGGKKERKSNTMWCTLPLVQITWRVFIEIKKSNYFRYLGTHACLWPHPRLRKTSRLLSGFYYSSVFIMHIHKQQSIICTYKGWVSKADTGWWSVHAAKPVLWSRILGTYQCCYLHSSTFSKRTFTAMINSNCQAPLRSSDNLSRGCCVCKERKTANGRRTGKKKKTKYGKMVTARRRWQETLIALPQLPTINNLHWEVQV